MSTVIESVQIQECDVGVAVSDSSAMSVSVRDVTVNAPAWRGISLSGAVQNIDVTTCVVNMSGVSAEESCAVLVSNVYAGSLAPPFSGIVGGIHITDCQFSQDVGVPTAGVGVYDVLGTSSIDDVCIRSNTFTGGASGFESAVVFGGTGSSFTGNVIAGNYAACASSSPFTFADEHDVDFHHNRIIEPEA